MKNRNLYIVSITVLVSLLSLSSWLYLLPIFLKDLGATDKNVGLSYTLFTLGGTGLQFIGGFLADRWGRKAVIVFPTYATAILGILMGIAKIWWVVTLLYTLTAIFSSFQWPAFLAIVGESCKNKERAFSIFEFSIVSGFALGPLVGYFLLNFTGIRVLIIGSGIIYLLSAITRHLFLHETLQERKSINLGLRRVFTENVIKFLLGSVTLYILFSITINGPFITLHMKTFGLSERKINLLISFSTLFSLLVSILSAKLLRSEVLKKFFIIGILIHGLSTLLWVYIFPKTFNVVLLMISFGAVQMVFIAYNSIISSLSPESIRARTIGTIGTINGLVSSGGPYLGMLIKMHFGIQWTFFTGFLFGIVSSFFFRKVPYPNAISK